MTTSSLLFRTPFMAASKVLLCGTVLCCSNLVAAADFTSSEGFNDACRQQPRAAQLKDDDARAAYAICRDTQLLKQMISWGTQGLERLKQDSSPSEEELTREVVTEIDYVRTQLADSRSVLEKIRLGKKKSLRITPAQWQMDLNGDGTIDTWEKYFFAIPNRNEQGFRLSAPSNDEDYYLEHYQLDATIHVDQSDVLWALAYHQFIGGLLDNIRAFDLDWKKDQLILARPQLMKSAHQLIGNGFKTSEKMRQSVMAETSDDEEWIANPRQKSSVFPLEVTDKSLATWGSLLGSLSALWQGQHLVPTEVKAGGLIGNFPMNCPAGYGFSIAKLYQNPPKAGTQYSLRDLPSLPKGTCVKVDSKHPVSRLDELVSQSVRTDPNLSFLRYLYWTN